jgi:hypothetical protein
VAQASSGIRDRGGGRAIHEGVKDCIRDLEGESGLR